MARETSRLATAHSLAPLPSGVGVLPLSLLFGVAVALAAVILYLQNNTFPFGVHPDEVKKVRFILTGQEDFNHPILMLQASRLANLFASFTNPDEVVRLGRTISALFGGLYVFASYLLARRSFSLAPSLAVAAAVAIVPLTALQAQPLKEDIYVSALLTVSLIALIALAERPARMQAVLFGLAAGLAFSAKFPALLMIAVALIVPFVCKLEDRAAYWRSLPIALGMACAVAFAVNAPAFFEPQTFERGVTYEMKHVAHGHGGVAISPFKSYFVHYVREGLIKGMGVPFAVAGLIGLVLALVRWKTLGNALRIPILFGLVWYFAHEIAPMKPGVSRYMVPMGVVMALTTVFLFRSLFTDFKARWIDAPAAAAVLLLALWPARTTFVYFLFSEPDTSSVAQSFAKALGGRIMIDGGVAYPPSLPEGLDRWPRRRGADPATDVAVLAHDWDYALTRHLGDRQTADAKLHTTLERFYRDLFKQSYVEIVHRWRDYEYRNRPMRIVALSGDGARLKALAATWPWPRTVRATFVPAVMPSK